MRATSHVYKASLTDSSEAPPSISAANVNHSMIMKAAWALHRSLGGSFAECLRSAWKHCKTNINSKMFNNQSMNSCVNSYISQAATEITSTFPVDDYRIYSENTRSALSETIQRLIDILDHMDGDPDVETDPDFECDSRYLRAMPACYTEEPRMGLNALDRN